MLLRATAVPDVTPLEAGAGYVRAAHTAAHGTTITHARSASPLRILTPRIGHRAAWFVTATLGGGLVGGDDIRLAIDVEAGARVLLTTQASTKVYRSAFPARQQLDAHVADAALLAVMPDPIVGFAGSSFEQRQRYDLEGSASLLAVDWVVSGRHAAGERWDFDRYASRFQVDRSGTPLFYDHLRLSRTDGPVAARMRRFQTYVVAVITGPLLATMAGQILAAVSASPTGRESDPVVSAAPCGRDAGVVLRIAGANVEQVGATLREYFRPIVSFLDDDPWARRW
jgi:urease accessory protein